MKKWKLLTGALAVVMAFTAIGCADVSDANASTYVSMSINPAIEMYADDDGVIISAGALNEDGEVVLADLEVVGKTVEEAGEDFVEASTELGYYDESDPNAEVAIAVDGADQEKANGVKKNLAEKLQNYFSNKGVNGKVSEETLNKYTGNVKKWGVSVGHAKMILRLLDLYPEMTEEQALELPISEVMAKIHAVNKDNKANNALAAERKAAIRALKEEYATTFELRRQTGELKERVKDITLSEKERVEIQATIDENQKIIDASFAEYKVKLRAIKDEYKAKK